MGDVLKHVELGALRGPAQVQVVVTMMMAVVQKGVSPLGMRTTEFAPVKFVVMAVSQVSEQ